MEKHLQVTFQNSKISAVRHASIVNYNLKFYTFFLMSDNRFYNIDILSQGKPEK
jgi:hypothetical protein